MANFVKLLTIARVSTQEARAIEADLSALTESCPQDVQSFSQSRQAKIQKKLFRVLRRLLDHYVQEQIIQEGDLDVVQRIVRHGPGKLRQDVVDALSVKSDAFSCLADLFFIRVVAKPRLAMYVNDFSCYI